MQIQFSIAMSIWSWYQRYRRGRVGSGTVTGTEQYDNGTSDGTVAYIVQVGNIEVEASNESKNYLMDDEDMDISVEEEDKEYYMAVPVQE